MRVRRSTDLLSFSVELTAIEARTFLEELSDIPGGSKLTKVRQICRALEVSFQLSDGAFDKPDASSKSIRKKS